MVSAITRREVLKGGVALGAAPALVPAMLRARAARPNILLIVADDLAAWMLGCYGSPEIRTPNLDRLAREGVRFQNSFVSTPICSASRATLFTGRIPPQHGIHDFLSPKPIDHPPQGQAAPPESFRREVFFSDLLAARGYACGYSGKWHMGWEDQPQHGFGHWYVMPGGSSRYQDPVMLRQGHRVQEKGYIGDLITGGAAEFLDARRGQPDPWLLVVAYNHPHTPYDGHPQKYYDLYKSENFSSVPFEPASPRALREKDFLSDPVGNLRKAAAATTALDDQVGALVSQLRARGLEENTIVVFTSDNGYLHGRHGLWSKGLASDPINMYEEVMRVPLVFRWPAGGWSGGRTPREMVSLYDFFPTVLDVAGEPRPSGSRPGQSCSEIASGKRRQWTDEVYGYFRNTAMVRDRRYKLVWRNQGSGPPGAGSGTGPGVHPGAEDELFDLVADPTEHHNLLAGSAAAAGPRRVRDRMARRLQAWLSRYK